MDARSRARNAAPRVGWVVVVLAVAGCVSRGASSSGTKTVTVTPSPEPTTSVSVATSSAAAGETPTTLPPPPAQQAKLPGDCESLLPLSDVQDTVGTTLSGKTAFVVGTPEKAIHRVAYLNCRYGLATSTADPLLEIGVSLYATASDAQARLNATVDDYSNHGATATNTDIGGRPTVVLLGGVGTSYAAPLLVVVSGQRTVAVSLAEQTGDSAFREQAMLALARLAIVRTGG